MKIKLDFTVFDFEYTSSIQVQKTILAKNSALSVQISSNENPVGKIDFTTLPNFHQYNLNEWKYTLENFFNENEVTLENIVLTVPYFNMVKDPLTPPLEGELLFVIESVLFAIIEKDFPATLSFIKNRNIKINGLYSPGTKLDNIPDCLKIKIRPTDESLIETKNLIASLIKVKSDILFRLDGNRSFELIDLIFFMTELEDFFGDDLKTTIEYLEEPLKNHYDSQTFFKLYPYPEALDESMITFINRLDDLKNLPANTHFIIKPSLIGLSKSFEISNLALASGHNMVISSSYETKSAIRPLLFLAATNPSTFHGLDTLKYLPKELGIAVENLSLTF